MRMPWSVVLGIFKGLLLVVCASATAGSLTVRLAAAWFFGARLLEDPTFAHNLWLVPVRDLLSAGLWLRSFFGHAVLWRGRRLTVGAGSRIVA
jgi:hypothetical protein